MAFQKSNPEQNFGNLSWSHFCLLRSQRHIDSI